MIKDIPLSFKTPTEDYITVPILKTFCSENNLQTNENKADLINLIISFANKTTENEIKVLKWLDKTLKEGIKKVLITKVKNVGNLKNKTKNEWEELIKNSFGVEKSCYIITKKHLQDIELCGYEFKGMQNKVDIVSLNFTVLLKEQKFRDSPYGTIIYPIFVDIYLNEGYLVGRSKSKSLLFKFKNEDEEPEFYESVNCEKLIRETFDKLFSALYIKQESNEYNLHVFKTSIHVMVDECTKTPDEIISKLNEEEEYRSKFVKDFFSRRLINPLEDNRYNDALKDIEIFMEKYLSISTHNKKIFTHDRYAYPTQIAATDSDFSSVEESSLEDIPLQCTPIFFDNKNLIQKQRKCDNVDFVFKRQPKKYFPSDKFHVTLQVKKGYMYIDFRKYVLEEDIENVLSRIIRCD